MEQNNGIWNAAFWKALVERVLSSVIGGALAVIGTEQVGITEIGWAGVASVAAGAGIVSLLKGVAAGLKNGNPSIGNVEVTK